MIGLAIGDAMGALIEFTAAREPEDYVTSYLTGGAHATNNEENKTITSIDLVMFSSSQLIII